MSRMPWLRVFASCAVESFKEWDRLDAMYAGLAGVIRDVHWNNTLTQSDYEVTP